MSDPTPTDATDPAAGESTEELSFEPAFARLESVVERLETEELPLDEALRLFEQGVGLTKRCRDLLDDAERRITQLIDADTEVPFGNDDSEAP